MGTFVNYKTAAAWSNIEKRLGDFKRGDDITLAWLERVGEIEDGHQLQGRLRTHFKKQGIVVEKVGDRYHLDTDLEQKEHASARREHTKREDVRIFQEVSAVDTDKLDQISRQEADHLRRHALARLDEHKKFERERRTILGVPEPRPQLQAVKSKP